MQRCFADPTSVWAIPGYSDVASVVERMVPAFGERVVFTRFVGTATDESGWAMYYARWPAMRRPEGDAMWNLTLPVPRMAHVITRPAFSKWDEEITALIPGAAPVVVCGVATEACVLATVLGAVDAGRRVVVATDACAGASADLHRAALQVLASFSPNVELTRTDQVVASVGSDAYPA